MVKCQLQTTLWPDNMVTLSLWLHTFERKFASVKVNFLKLHKVIFEKFVKAGSGSAFLKQLDPDPH